MHLTQVRFAAVPSGELLAMKTLPQGQVSIEAWITSATTERVIGGAELRCRGIEKRRA